MKRRALFATLSCTAMALVWAVGCGSDSNGDGDAGTSDASTSFDSTSTFDSGQSTFDSGQSGDQDATSNNDAQTIQDGGQGGFGDIILVDGGANRDSGLPCTLTGRVEEESNDTAQTANAIGYAGGQTTDAGDSGSDAGGDAGDAASDASATPTGSGKVRTGNNAVGGACGEISTAGDVDFYKFTMDSDLTKLNVLFSGAVKISLSTPTVADAGVLQVGTTASITVKPGEEYTMKVELGTGGAAPTTYIVQETESK